uniref:Uncharacterized protein n=1 Tax=uncultured alpha proteobacterium EB000_37G09 TaxID=710792 RepID=E0XZK3_9PROT|nr:hypothetical protein [uncultured alpha proteobacterium EB000_37G09]
MFCLRPAFPACNTHRQWHFWCRNTLLTVAGTAQVLDVLFHPHLIPSLRHDA